MAAFAAGAAALLGSGVASAQQATFYLDRIQVSGQPDDGLVLWRPYLYEKTRFYGATTLGYTLNPLRADALADNPNVIRAIDNPVKNQLSMFLSAGAEVSGRYSVGLTLPLVLAQGGGDDPQARSVGDGLGRSSPVAGDLRLNAKVKVYETDNHKLNVGIGGAAWVPTGNATAFAGDDQMTAYLYGAAEYDFGKFSLGGQIGPHFRPERGILNTNGRLQVGSELRWAVGAFLPLRQGDIRLGATLWGTTGVESETLPNKSESYSTFFNGRNTDVEWLGEVRVILAKQYNLFFNGGAGTRLSAGYGSPDVRVLAQIGAWTTLIDFGPGQVSKARRKAPDVEMHDKDTDGDGYPDDIDQCPTEKEDGKPPDPDDGCPAPKDRDGDGIPDDADKCPDKPEDKDGILDGDGCPETDADGDGVLDVEDACPLVAGMKSKDPKKNGCKEEHKKIVETAGGIQLLEPIQFDTGKSTIKSVSYPILDEVVEVLKSHSEVRMGVYGHTDSKGAAQMNRMLSKERARAVVNYLASHGINPKRLESDGFGPDKPIDTNDTEEGRAKNRRVEFKVIE
ncbi:MAG TPA: OmpA family protein [Polyangiaceae bacterium]|nr:OmpA family protein [Polyangiaceae bacterium]